MREGLPFLGEGMGFGGSPPRKLCKIISSSCILELSEITKVHQAILGFGDVDEG